ncbi:haloacid dehalogenase-like hydrolase domain-containing protein 3 [Mytilus galloprovincialis]|uniref:haloacid dehalogenase-like hydrolase domain-containing protein 3 n=1 Tax=Mytilus galloprovincialis TaxID=29158 RepID=UPI003F7BDED2
MIKLLTLDATNTVIRVLGGVGHQYASTASIYGIKADPEKLDVSFRTKWKEHNLKYPNYGVSSGITSHGWWNELVKQTFISSGYADTEVLSKVATHLYLHFKTNKGWEVLPNSQNVLQDVKSKGIKLGVISNFDERLETVLSSLGLLHYFDFVLCSRLAGHAKPQPQIYEKALELSGISASDALHVGDHIDNDYMGPRNIGMSSVLLCNNAEKIPDHVDKKFVITNLVDILKCI